MAAPVTFTLDLEDHRPDDRAPFRVPGLLDSILDFLDERGVVATVFVVGELAESNPDLVRSVADRGHEVALHAWRHVPLTELTPAALADDVARGKTVVESISGVEVVGFRAPIFSLVESTVWATDVLTDAGFTYSSSVLPARNPLFGFPGAPSDPFRWPSGLVELPCPVGGIGPLKVPHLGGVYFRVLPPVVGRALRGAGDTAVPWLYCHPYDFDAGEEYWVVPDAGRLGSRLLWLNRARLFDRVDRLLRDGAGAPLRERAAALDGLPTFDIPTAVAA
jgi:polysaccharide deacetylase family protein (PEP-CTERM system associated)